MLLRLLYLLFVAASLTNAAEPRPNFIWIVAEDMGPEVGCYGDSYARTPNLDQFAKTAVRFERAFTHAPVCAPSRSGLISGRYPTSIGSHHMRSKLLNPPPAFTKYLREAGYKVYWPGKTDFNFDVQRDWFDSTKEWLTNPPQDRPFFAYINLTESHESQVRQERGKFERVTQVLSPEQRHDPAKGTLPPYYPDTPAVRRDWASYHDLVTVIDHRVGRILKQLEEKGLTENTVIFFFGDHGRGLPRGKRWVYDSGIRVPLIIRWPGKLDPGTVRNDLVCFLDFAPTVLSLAGVKPLPKLDGQVFLGPDRAPDRKYVYAARDRMDETYDRIRAVRDKQFKYIRNFHPELPYARRIAYMDEMPTMKEWRRLNEEKKLTGPQTIFFSKSKPKEELYDTAADPHEVRNLAGNAEYKAKLEEMRSALDAWIRETGDLGAVPEKELIARGLVADKLSEYEQRKEPGYKSN